MGFTFVWLTVVCYAYSFQAAPVNETRPSLVSTYNVQNLYMNNFYGYTPGSSAKSRKTVVEPEKALNQPNNREHARRIKWENRILQEVTVLGANGNHTARTVDRLARELVEYEDNLLQAIRELSRNNSIASSEFITEATLNETLLRMQRDLEFLRKSVSNISKTTGETSFPKDCNGVFARGYTRTGVYIIKPDGAKRPYMVRCELDDEPWTVLMRSFLGIVDFNRTWKEYKNGFGNPESEYSVGNDFMHMLTAQRSYKARFDMKVWSTGATAYSESSHFWVGPESGGYQLSVSGESGTAKRNGMLAHNGMKFSTKDKDNDKHSRNCAVICSGGWWFNGCYNVLFTGPYDTKCDTRCSRWYGGLPLKEMSIRVTRI